RIAPTAGVGSTPTNLGAVFTNQTGDLTGDVEVAGGLYAGQPGKLAQVELTAEQRTIGAVGEPFTRRLVEQINIDTAVGHVFLEDLGDLLAHFIAGGGAQGHVERRAGFGIFADTITIGVQVASFVKQRIRSINVIRPAYRIFGVERVDAGDVGLDNFRAAVENVVNHALAVGAH